MNLYTSLIEVLKALTSFLNVAPLFLLYLSNQKLHNLNEEIIKLESAADPKHRSRLGELRIQQEAAREFHAAVLARIAPVEAGQPGAND
jgi:hypothetical protein